jgi:transposase-like protein
VIDILVQPHRDQRAAERFFRRLLRDQGIEPLRIITDKLKSYSAAIRTIPSQCESHCGGIRQQSSRSLTSVDPPARTANAPIQIR